MTPAPSGVLRPDGIMCFTRRLLLSREDAWRLLTEPEQTERWIGPWEGDPATGVVALTMTSEEPGPPSQINIRECVAPARLVLDTGEPMRWELAVTIDADPEHPDDAARCVLALEQEIPDAEMASMVGPGWDFYLDRLVAVATGVDPGAITFEPDYLPGMADAYRALYAQT